ncbi:MAG: HutD family protein [Pseudoxanthomonas sp.]|nr:HutD family protein [Pseudoxanthomonas sp.]
MRVLPAAGYRLERWRNGGGSTRVIAAAGRDGDIDGQLPDWDWRLSLADIDGPGPFSILPGVARHLMLVEGGPLSLRVGTAIRTLSAAGDEVRFGGSAPVDVRPDTAPARVLNLMWRDANLCGRLQRVALPGWRPPVIRGATVCWLLYLLAGELGWPGANLGPGDTLLAGSGEGWTPPAVARGHGILAHLEALAAAP